MDGSVIAASALIWIVRLPVILFAITVHEYAHGRVAYLFGDPTAKMMGRLTFNPFSHLDPMGAICFLLVGFGWAKPVPIDPRYFKNPRRDQVLVSLAGPLSNIATAVVCGIILRYLFWQNQQFLMVFSQMVVLNLAFALFNLLPIPPLDGSHVVEGVLPLKQAYQYKRWSRYGPMVLLGILLFDNLTHAGILNAVLGTPIMYLSYYLGGGAVIAGLHLLSLLH